MQNELTTKRLRLRHFTPQDAADVQRLANNWNVARMLGRMPYPYPEGGAAQWIAGIYLGVGGGALAFTLWVMALQLTTPTLVANTMTVNPIAAGLLATQLVGEPITLNLVFGLVAVFAGIWTATTRGRPKMAPAPQ